MNIDVSTSLGIVINTLFFISWILISSIIISTFCNPWPWPSSYCRKRLYLMSSTGNLSRIMPRKSSHWWCHVICFFFTCNVVHLINFSFWNCFWRRFLCKSCSICCIVFEWMWVCLPWCFNITQRRWRHTFPFCKILLINRAWYKLHRRFDTSSCCLRTSFYFQFLSRKIICILCT